MPEKRSERMYYKRKIIFFTKTLCREISLGAEMKSAPKTEGSRAKSSCRKGPAVCHSSLGEVGVQSHLPAWLLLCPSPAAQTAQDAKVRKGQKHPSTSMDQNKAHLCFLKNVFCKKKEFLTPLIECFK